MAKKKPLSSLHLEIENEDWVAITGAPAELERLGLLMIEFARNDAERCLILDSPSDYFRDTSLGITLYKNDRGPNAV